jgi:spore germination protein YaaH
MTGVNVISPTWFSISSNDGDISSLASEEYVKTAHDQGLEVWALVDNFNESVDTTQVLSSTSSRGKLVNQLIAAALQYGLDGINIDFESLEEEAGDGYIQFIREISVKCRLNGIVLSVDDPVPMSYTAFYDREEQGIVADYVIIMGYDEHYAGSEEAGSVASLTFEKEGIENTLKEVPAEKIISGVPFYTRIWQTDASGAVTSEAVGMSTAEQWVTDNGLTTNWSQETSQDYAEVETADGSKYQVWLENERSLEEKAKLVKEYDLGGIAAWKLGLEKASVWDVISSYTQ